jgi:hypothetical protein
MGVRNAEAAGESRRAVLKRFASFRSDPRGLAPLPSRPCHDINDSGEPHADLRAALGAPNDQMVFVESIMDRYDAPAAVIHSGNNGAEL